MTDGYEEALVYRVIGASAIVISLLIALLSGGNLIFIMVLGFLGAMCSLESCTMRGVDGKALGWGLFMCVYLAGLFYMGLHTQGVLL